MSGVNIPYIPASIWAIAAALTMVVLIIMLIFYAYSQRRLKAIIKDGGDLADLLARKDQAQSDVGELRHWINEQKNELLQLTAEREHQERVRAELTDLENRCLARDQENQSLRKEVGELENQRYTLGQTLARLQQEIGVVEHSRQEAEDLGRKIEELKSQLEEAKSTLVKQAEAEIRLEALDREKMALERWLASMHSETESTKANMESVRTEFEEKWREVAELRKERAQLDALVAILRPEQYTMKNDIEQLEKQITLRTIDKDRLEKIVKEKSEAAEETKILLRELAHKKIETESAIQQLEVRMQFKESELEKLTREIDLKNTDSGLGDNKREEDTLKPYHDLFEKEPSCLIKEKFGAKRSVDDTAEYDALEKLKKQLREGGYHFSSRAIDAFHTSLKCQSINPLTVLAGISGTGKTLLPIKYAELMGIHALVMPVQPRWDSPQDIFGFYNYLEKEYKATDLSRSLVRMDPYNYKPEDFPALKDCAWAKERMFMVLLDEMNLARTEYYFSEFLSRLELRRQVENEKRDLPEHREKAEIELDAGPSKQRFRLWVPENVLFVGTMNEDETTQTLSDKVLDRANVLRFGRPGELSADEVGVKSDGDTNRAYLSFKQWQKWQHKPTNTSPWKTDIGKWAIQLNDSLEKIGHPFGFRVQDAITQYVANYPQTENDDRYKIAFADQVEQKIIPKLRGLDVVESKATDCLDGVAGVIEKLNDNELSKAFEAATEESKTLGMFTWRGVTRKLDS